MRHAMQNVLPLLAYNPDRVIQILSEGDKYRSAARSTEAAAKEAGLGAEFHIKERRFLY